MGTPFHEGTRRPEKDGTPPGRAARGTISRLKALFRGSALCKALILRIIDTDTYWTTRHLGRNAEAYARKVHEARTAQTLFLPFPRTYLLPITTQ